MCCSLVVVVVVGNAFNFVQCISSYIRHNKHVMVSWFRACLWYVSSIGCLVGRLGGFSCRLNWWSVGRSLLVGRAPLLQSVSLWWQADTKGGLDQWRPCNNCQQLCTLVHCLCISVVAIAAIGAAAAKERETNSRKQHWPDNVIAGKEMRSMSCCLLVSLGVFGVFGCS